MHLHGRNSSCTKAARDLRAPGVDAPHLAARRLRSLDECLGERVGVAADARASRHYQHLARHNRPLSLVMRPTAGLSSCCPGTNLHFPASHAASAFKRLLPSLHAPRTPSRRLSVLIASSSSVAPPLLDYLSPCSSIACTFLMSAMLMPPGIPGIRRRRLPFLPFLPESSSTEGSHLLHHLLGLVELLR